MYIGIKKLTPEAILPTHGTKNSAGWDLYTLDEEVVLKEGEKKLVGTGLSFEIPEGYFGAIYPRSGLSTKQGIVLRNLVAVIDSDYRGEVKLPLWNVSDCEQIIPPHTRVAQLIIQPYLRDVEWTECDELSNTERGEGGFGSTGTK